MDRIWTKHKQINTTFKPKVVVAMSGGVDSSVSAALLKKQGYDVMGVFMKNWSDNSVIKNNSVTCPWAQDQYDARRVADKLGINFYTFNFEKEYKESVVDYFFREYQAGRTPNPDVMCNKIIKFGIFLKQALSLGVDYIATGHYARLRREFPISNFQFSNKFQNSNSKPLYKLLRGIDKNKDQSYFLWTLTQEQLKHTLFPIGGLTKPHVRYLASKFGLPVAQKKDSQGICFIGPVNVREFLKERINPQKGSVTDSQGRILGKHEGVWFYTVGQRHGFSAFADSPAEALAKAKASADKGGGVPLYVVEKDLKTNTLVVAPENTLKLYQKEFIASEVNWINPDLLQFGVFKCQVQVRYRQSPVDCEVRSSNANGVKIILEEPVRAITPGQSVVFYKGQELLGGGIIQ